MSSVEMKTVAITEVEDELGIDSATLHLFIQREWITPYTADFLDEEDLARIRLIQEVRDTFLANDEAVDLILHLVDQVYSLRAKIRNTRNE